MKITTELVFVPAPGLSHIVSTVEFAKSLIQRDENLAVTVLVIKSPFHSLGASYIAETSSSNPLIKFIHLPHLNPPDPTCTKSPENYICLFIEQYKIHVKDVITNNVLSNPNLSLGGLVVDFLCSSMIDVAKELGVPSYMFFTAGNAFLSLFLYLPNHYSLKGSEFTESDPDSIIPGFLNPVPTSVIPSFCFDDGGYRCFLNHGIRMRQTKGIFVNTFLEFDKQSFESLALDPQVPPIYTVGPILNLQIQQDKPDSNRDKIIQWLNNQPSASVIFLCFGSFGSFGEAQLAQMATALERSGHRFLWSVRKKLTSQTFRLPGEYADFAEALPEGFLERTKDRGLVCGYAPQLEVLGNEAVGCFVTHCGWNSVLESLWFGKPIVTWPLYAEQQLNAFQLVKEVGLAVGLEIDYRYEKGDEKIVKADVIEKAIKSAMDPENPLRKRTKEMSEISRKAIEEGGSSFMSINRFVKDLYLNKL